MRWSPEATPQHLQVRTAVPNDELAQHLKRWHPDAATNDPFMPALPEQRFPTVSVSPCANTTREIRRAVKRR